ncbi:GTP cyclohydrolase II [Aestuariivirga sp.]|uniref:GTP cyclohydrolase II n=1 Tax=Aestuariivirga sp. TaxID=2650926 RepID=UPI0039E6C3E6
MSALPVALNPRTLAGVEEIARARMPSAYSDGELEMRAFRDRATGIEHVALVKAGKASLPLVRIHSECLTGEAFGSLRCDCGPQLQEAIRQIDKSEGGAVIYLRGHEGRGIGLANKIRAYALQDQGMDTVEANLALGFDADGRDFAIAARILESLGMSKVELLSNNPAKSLALQDHGITVAAVRPIEIDHNPHNKRYLEAKRDKFGHALSID